MVSRYNELLKNFPLVRPWGHPDTKSCFHLYVVRLKLDEIGKTHREVFEGLRREGICVNLHYMPVYLHPYYRRLGFKKGLCAEAERYYAEAITLPLYYGLKDGEQDRVVKTLKKILS